MHNKATELESGIDFLYKMSKNTFWPYWIKCVWREFFGKHLLTLWETISCNDPGLLDVGLTPAVELD